MRVTINPSQEPSPTGHFKPGSLVIDHDGWIVLVSHDKHEYVDYFAGTIISVPEQQAYRIGDHCTEWNRRGFVKFVGYVLLEQE